MINQIFKPINLVGTKSSKIVNALIDTGATYLVISKDLAEEIGVESTGQYGIADFVLCHAVIRPELVKIKSVNFEGKTTENVLAFIIDTGYDLIAGYDFLEKIGVLQRTGKLKITY